MQPSARKAHLDAVQDPVIEALQDALRETYDEAYEAGFGDGHKKAEEEAAIEAEANGPLDELIATVKEFQIRSPYFEPIGKRHLGREFYDHLIRFLESGELPPEWQP